MGEADILKDQSADEFPLPLRIGGEDEIGRVILGEALADDIQLFTHSKDGFVPHPVRDDREVFQPPLFQVLVILFRFKEAEKVTDRIDNAIIVP
jgi:hypothetical protein